MTEDLLFVLFVLPLVGACLVALLPAREPGIAKGLTLATALAELGVGLAVLGQLDPNLSGPQLASDVAWVTPIGLRISLAIDGLSLWPLALVVCAVPLALLGGWSAVRSLGRELGVPLLVLQGAAIGVVLAQDVGLLVGAWELALLASWGLLVADARTATLRWAGRWLIGAQLGAGLMLAAFLYLAVGHYESVPGTWSLSLADLERVMLPAGAQAWAFAGVAVAVAFAVPVFPLHAWVPGVAASRNPVASAVVLAVLIELGVFVLRRHGVALFPLGALELAQPLAWLALATMAHGVLALRTEQTLARMAGYLVLVSAGIELIGALVVHPDALVGTALFGFGRGLGTVALLVMVAAVHDATGEEAIDRIRGLGRRSPLLAGLLLLAVLAVSSAPGFAGFPGALGVLGALVSSQSVLLGGMVPIALLSAVALVVAAGVGLGRWQQLVAEGSTDPARPVLATRTAVTLVVTLLLCIGLGARPLTAFERGLWPARERTEAVQLRMCQSLGAQSLQRPVFYDELLVDCADPLEVIRPRPPAKEKVQP